MGTLFFVFGAFRLYRQSLLNPPLEKGELELLCTERKKELV